MPQLQFFIISVQFKAMSSSSDEKSTKTSKRGSEFVQIYNRKISTKCYILGTSENEALDDLLSMEKLDRASPELWPEKS